MVKPARANAPLRIKPRRELLMGSFFFMEESLVWLEKNLENEFIEIVTYLQNNYLNETAISLLWYQDHILYL
jgi:hypothetical protein